ncbi:NAD(P)-binding Rossmann-fold containing protein [Glarea lozoyensis ATCC 20868]|uniref:NAD(P)-binding Rossmann-fold containing protein n=1 Tax=Glarea lozoyensis (strain ATCC 20868 / MF5171) TaxID=1116229 RepID=S3DCG9_GLAL2|nr:NAD(P)-binding Rossmann-fold containing protein [Glarea lozoyensis ATCC 20868]EPE34769.1 NAD(P)-binding Rossmann-fold containing protein [Glarea lozoyensis ATCC 20868]
MADLKSQTIFSVLDRTAVISGGGGGLGRMVAKSLLVNGASVTIIDQFQHRLDVVEAELLELKQKSKLPGQIRKIQGDLGHEIGLKSVISQIKATHNEVDILVTAAGIRKVNKTAFTPGESLSDLVKATNSLSYEDLDASFRINLYAQYFLTAGLLDLLGAAAAKGDGRGSVIMFSSVAAKHNGQFVPAYQLSKAAVDHLVRIMAAEFADHYIRVNAISPGLFPSNMNPMDPAHPDSNMKFANDMPARRPGTEEEMAATALYLASKAGAYMTGANMVVDGGRMLVAAGKISSKL